ncbi:Regulator of ribonuclease activity B [Nannocystis exedens]|uniref:Regulator of ribonuclease activity B n=1 Tax=Nannocystis exedens TaxID=54 RepID=A0A1I2IBR9_9BACT|nr:DUF695 domain-containing protein [Nannocystis exedens]SFF39684.1 Regulator of ribonuclease activity B [Nannocystis exedens]
MKRKTDTGRPTWQAQFDVYLAAVDGAPASFVLDMGLAPHVPVRSHPLRLQVRVRLLHPREDGLQDASELKAMGEVEDAITGRVSAMLDGIYAGRFTCEGRTTYVFYLSAAQAVRADELASIIGDLGPYEWEWLTEDDPQWDYFTGFLYPDPLSLQAMANRQLLENLEAKGDQLELPREVDHRAYFPTREDAVAAAEDLRSVGFRTDEAKPLEDDVRRWALDLWCGVTMRSSAAGSMSPPSSPSGSSVPSVLRCGTPAG